MDLHTVSSYPDFKDWRLLSERHAFSDLQMVLSFTIRFTVTEAGKNDC